MGSAADRAGLEARLGVMEELWSSKLLEAGFDTPLCISSQLHSLPVLRQQPIALVVQTKSTIATCRLDLGHLPPIAAEAARAGAPPRCEMQFELPLVRHGITVGCATGVLLVAPGIGGGAAELQAGQAASRRRQGEAARLASQGPGAGAGRRWSRAGTSQAQPPIPKSCPHAWLQANVLPFTALAPHLSQPKQKWVLKGTLCIRANLIGYE